MDIPTLETARLRLGAPTSRHFDAFAAVFADPQFVKHFGIEPRGREASHRSYCAALGHWQLRGWGAFLVEERDSGELVGCVGLSDWEGWPEPELGWWTIPSMWGRGYAPEAARAALDYFASLRRTSRLVSFVPPANAASIRVAEKLGASYERDFELHGTPVRVYVHDLALRTYAVAGKA
jgi:[ribosomal protein S5]-alanine N-acetyltransferase